MKERPLRHRSDARPDVAVVIPTRNRLGMLKQAVASVLTQSLRNVELIIVDDASSDGTTEWALGLKSRQVAYVRLEEHVERSIARNRGLGMANAPYVLFLDDDDLLAPNALDVLSTALDHHSDAVAAVGRAIMFGEKGGSLPHTRFARTLELWPEILAGWNAVPGQTLLRTEEAVAERGFDEKIVASIEDREFLLRMARRGPIVLSPALALHYRVHPGQWRPAGHLKEWDERRRSFVAGLSGPEAELGRRMLDAATTWERAESELWPDRPARALTAYLSTAIRQPRLIASAATRPALMRGLGKSAMGSLLGRSGGEKVTTAIARLRRLIAR